MGSASKKFALAGNFAAFSASLHEEEGDLAAAEVSGGVRSPPKYRVGNRHFMKKAPFYCLTAGLFLWHGLASAQIIFTLDPSRSALSITNANFSESINGSVVASGPLTAQAPGSTTTTYSGTLSAVLGAGATPATITFNSAAAAAAQTGSYTPTTTSGSGAGGSGTQLADYGLTGAVMQTGSNTTVAINAAADAVVFSLASGTIPINNGTFSLSSINVPIAGNYAYRSGTTAFGTIRGGGAFAPGNPPTPTDASALTGTYTVANGIATLTIPIDVTYTSTSSNLSGSGTATVVTEITGTLTATAAVPEPATWAMLLGGSVLLGCSLHRSKGDATAGR